MEFIEKMSELTKEDAFLIAVSVKRGDNIETQCLTNNFAYADIPIATQDMLKNIGKLAVQAAPPTPLAFQEAANPESIPEPDGVVYAEGEEE